MSLNEYNNKRRYTHYQRHVDESKERISAAQINKIQKDAQFAQEENNAIKDKAFEERVYTIFENNYFVNAAFKDQFENGNYIDIHSSTDIIRDQEQLAVMPDDGKSSGVMKSTIVYSPYGEDVEMNDFFLITSEQIPQGAEIKYYIENYLGQRWQIKPNTINKPLHLPEHLRFGFRLVAVMRRNALDEEPVLNGYAVLYWDAMVEKGLGLTDPDLQRFP